MLKFGVLFLLASLVLAGCSSAPKPVPLPPASAAAPATSIGPKHDEVLFHAFSLVGTPYRYGGSSPATGFDCSGLINYVYREAAGLALPRTTAGLYALDKPRRQASAPLQPGDLVLFAMSGRSVDHAGIYVGDGRFLHAPSTGGRVRVDSLHANHWQRSFKGSRRVLD
jgi:cell wall-associated NlpC family hydrolase